MEDNKRAEKLSAARKLLKEHQKKIKKTEVPSSTDNIRSTNVTELSDVPDHDISNYVREGSSAQSSPNMLQDVETSSITSSKSSNHVNTLFPSSDSTNSQMPEAQSFFDQIPTPSNYNGVGDFTASNVSFSNAVVPESTNQYNSATSNGHTAHVEGVEYYQYFNLYNDALKKINWYEQQLETTKAVEEQRLNQAVAELQEKIQFQCRSIEIALSEKSDLQRQLDAVQEENKSKTATCEELANRLKASRNHVFRLEKELTDIQEARMQHNSILKKLEINVQEHKQSSDRYKCELDEAKEQIVELKKSLDSAGGEYSIIEKKLAEKESQLSLALIKVQQLGGGNSENSVSQSALPEVDIESLKQRITELSKENEQISQQYQEYINNLNSQLQETTSMYESTLVVKDEQVERISSLVSHVSELEKQIQKHSVNIPQSLDLIEKNNALKVELENSNAKIASLQGESDTQKAELEQANSELAVMKTEVEWLEERLDRLIGEVPDAKLLQAAMESDKVAAARAITQNTQLKQQLQELQDAYIKLQNAKLELTEQLDEIKRRFSDLQEELARYIKKEVSRSDGSTEMRQISIVDGCCQTTYYDLEAVKTGPGENVTPEAAALLEDKFKSTMNKLAQVLDEKQVLEHLVTKLQSETETIGEYVALYQMQRCKLEKREHEKDQIVAIISKEKEELRSKLAEISALVPSLLNRESHVSVGEEAVEVEEKPVSISDNIVANETASKIIDLLNEIGTSQLVKESNHSQDNCSSTFHPCALCSGSLITV